MLAAQRNRSPLTPNRQPIPGDGADVFNSILAADEKLLWWSSAKNGLIFYGSDWLNIIGGFVLIAVSLAMALQILTSRAETGNWILGGLICGLIFLFGISMAFGRAWRDAHRRKRSLYAVTNQRALIWFFGRKNRVTEIPLPTLEKCRLVERRHGDGTVVLGRDLTRWFGSSFHTTLAPRFELAGNALWVYRLIEAVRSRTYWLSQ